MITGSAAGLEQGLQDSLQLLASPAGAMVKQLLPSDPTGAMLNLLEDWGGARSGPSLQHGVWFSDDGRRALLLAETRAPAFDIDAQQQVGDAIRQAFDESRSSPELRLLMSGPSVFAVQSRNLIHNDAWRLSLVAMLLVAIILLLAYGSPRLLGLGILPVASGALVGIAAVSLSYGNVHGITLGFGATLIGEAVDYPTYLFTQRAAGESLRDTLGRIWPTLRLAVLTTVFGSLTMLLSGFSGLSQLGMFSLVGVLAAGLVTRYVLPEIAPGHFAIANRARRRPLLARGASMLSGLKWLPLLVSRRRCRVSGNAAPGPVGERTFPPQPDSVTGAGTGPQPARSHGRARRALPDRRSRRHPAGRAGTQRGACAATAGTGAARHHGRIRPDCAHHPQRTHPGSAPGRFA